MKIGDLLKGVIEEGLILEETHFPELGLPDTPDMKRGKVRDNYFLDDSLLMVTTDRVSAFDVNMRQGLPLKGYVLGEQMDYMFKEAERSGIKHHVEKRVAFLAFKTKRVKPGKIEWVFRRHLYGSGWRDVNSGKFADKYGFEITPDMVEDGKIRMGCRLKQTICTPTTKADEGHDEPLKRQKAIEIYGDEKVYTEVEGKYRRFFDHVYQSMLEKGIIIPDTKFEEGDGLLIDEIFTSDSSRFWPAETFEENLRRGKDQISMDKEYLRQWLIDAGFKGQGVDIPVPVRINTMKGYLNALQKMTGKTRKQMNKELESFCVTMKCHGGPENMIYDALLGSKVIRGYCAVVLAGSGSDLKVKEEWKKETKRLFETLRTLEVPHSYAVVSGHKDPERLSRVVKWADQYPGDVIFIDLTGLSNGKGPTTAGGLTSKPVLFCYARGEDKDGQDLFSSVNVPRVVPLGVYNGGVNTALGAAQILGLSHPELKDNVEKYKAEMRAAGLDDSMKFGGSYRPG
jgi:phosphoribosylaminoimidazole-succinocarboxamide synthase